MELEEALDFIDLNKTGSLEFYFPNGKVMYSLSSENHTFTERRYYKTGERSQGVYQNDSGKFISYDRNGKVVEEYIDRYPLHSGKFVEECNCQ
jgi:antitoxin component YwqK of YwqJK toxin-antitoxin module